MSSDSVVLPGQVLGHTQAHVPGPGTHVHGDKILSSITGFLTTSTSLGVASDSKQTPKKQHKSSSSVNTKIRPILSVSALNTPAHQAPVLPVVGDHVYGRVTVIMRVQANLEIIAISQSQASPQLSTETDDDDSIIKALADAGTPTSYRPLATPVRGILRSQDVRMTEKDRVKMASAVSVGDIVRAAVVGIGDQGGYFVSTAGNELGVVMAWSARGNGCVPLSWCEVGDVVTGEKEERKVAKPI
jgi:exosome complex component CSL4